MHRRNFLKLGALFVPAAAVAPWVAYSFLWAPRAYPWEGAGDARFWDDQVDALTYAMAVSFNIPLPWLRAQPPAVMGRMLAPVMALLGDR